MILKEQAIGRCRCCRRGVVSTALQSVVLRRITGDGDAGIVLSAHELCAEPQQALLEEPDVLVLRALGRDTLAWLQFADQSGVAGTDQRYTGRASLLRDRVRVEGFIRYVMESLATGARGLVSCLFES